MKLLQGATQEKILGTVWNHAKDMLLSNVNPPNDITPTERTVLSQIARIFDPIVAAVTTSCLQQHGKNGFVKKWET